MLLTSKTPCHTIDHPHQNEKLNCPDFLLLSYFDTPTGKRINTLKRVRLILGFFKDEVPELFWELRRQALRHDRYIRIDFVRFTQIGGLNGKLSLTRIVKWLF